MHPAVVTILTNDLLRVLRYRGWVVRPWFVSQPPGAILMQNFPGPILRIFSGCTIFRGPPLPSLPLTPLSLGVGALGVGPLESS